MFRYTLLPRALVLAFAVPAATVLMLFEVSTAQTPGSAAAPDPASARYSEIILRTSNGGTQPVTINFNTATISRFRPDKQALAGDYAILDDGRTMTLSGNTWIKVTPEAEIDINQQTVLGLQFSVLAPGEIQGVLLVPAGPKRPVSKYPTFTLAGSQPFGTMKFAIPASERQPGARQVTIPVGEYVTGRIKSIVLINDNDAGAAPLPEDDPVPDQPPDSAAHHPVLTDLSELERSDRREWMIMSYSPAAAFLEHWANVPSVRDAQVGSIHYPVPPVKWGTPTYNGQVAWSTMVDRAFTQRGILRELHMLRQAVDRASWKIVRAAATVREIATRHIEAMEARTRALNRIADELGQQRRAASDTQSTDGAGAGP